MQKEESQTLYFAVFLINHLANKLNEPVFKIYKKMKATNAISDYILCAAHTGLRISDGRFAVIHRSSCGDAITVYHGSTFIIKNPNVSKSKKMFRFRQRILSDNSKKKTEK